MINTGMKGFLRLQTINKYTGEITSDTGFFPNKLLLAGMNIMADRSDWMDYCHVGTDGTDPLATDTGLLGYHTGTGALSPAGVTWGTQASAPYYGWKRKTFRFPAGTVEANLSEVGVGWTDGSVDQNTLISRAKILDPVSGLPTTITPLADELLDVTYELRYYPPLVDVVGPQITLNGVVYNTITRAANVTGGRWSQDIGEAIGQYSPFDSSWAAFNGTIGTILTGPNGVQYDSDNHNHYNSAYSNNSYERQVNCAVGATGWNASGGIRSVRFQTTAGEYQTEFSAVSDGSAIPKTSLYLLRMAWMIGWGELPLPWVLPTQPSEEYSIGDRVTHNDVQWTSDIDDNDSEPGVANWTLS